MGTINLFFHFWESAIFLNLLCRLPLLFGGGPSYYLQYFKMMCAYSKLLNQCVIYTYRIGHNVFSGILILKHIYCYLEIVLLPDEKKMLCFMLYVRNTQSYVQTLKRTTTP